VLISIYFWTEREGEGRGYRRIEKLAGARKGVGGVGGVVRSGESRREEEW
jgi:hypothetical protein